MGYAKELDPHFMTVTSYITVEAVNCGVDFSEDLQVKRVVYECVAGKLEIVPLRAQLPSFRVILLVFESAVVTKEEKKENQKTCRIVRRSYCANPLRKSAFLLSFPDHTVTHNVNLLAPLQC